MPKARRANLCDRRLVHRGSVCWPARWSGAYGATPSSAGRWLVSSLLASVWDSTPSSPAFLPPRPPCARPPDIATSRGDRQEGGAAVRLLARGACCQGERAGGATQPLQLRLHQWQQQRRRQLETSVCGAVAL
eukprot:365087-Chlamydomonas_euryale.AAC.5